MFCGKIGKYLGKKKKICKKIKEIDGLSVIYNSRGKDYGVY